MVATWVNPGSQVIGRAPESTPLNKRHVYFGRIACPRPVHHDYWRLAQNLPLLTSPICTAPEPCPWLALTCSGKWEKGLGYLDGQAGEFSLSRRFDGS